MKQQALKVQQTIKLIAKHKHTLAAIPALSRYPSLKIA